MTDLHKLTVDGLAQEIRRVDGNHDMGAGRLAEALMPYLERALSAQGMGQHPDDVAVDRFAAEMKAKLAAARVKGRCGWDDNEDLQQHLSNLLRGHVDKGDPRDVANFCCFLWNRGEGIAPAPSAAMDDAMAILRDRSWGLVPFEMPTGAGDVDIGWRVIEWHRSKADPVTVAEVYHDDPAAAITAALHPEVGNGN